MKYFWEQFFLIENAELYLVFAAEVFISFSSVVYSLALIFILYLKANIFGTTRKFWLVLMGDWQDNESGCNCVWLQTPQ